MKKKILVIHGPNLNLLGVREPHLYGRSSLPKINGELKKLGKTFKVAVECVQSNSESKLIDKIQAARSKVDGLIINPGGFSHTSVAIRDALAALEIPKIEVHLTNPQAREEFRRQMITAGAVDGVISGFGAHSYMLALQALFTLIRP